MSEIAMRAVIVANPTSRHVDMFPHGALFETKQCAGQIKRSPDARFQLGMRL
ncbi:hypothetical protein [Bradyrhizobium cosmicum]|uniref:hypothetical protein n=1 Tax=Bradyrhizobium cosmicum TaxID=1404864 RepID=UPI00143DAB97|nr:hypothetical protein [Bradyrhizobium cosmicum]